LTHTIRRTTGENRVGKAPKSHSYFHFGFYVVILQHVEVRVRDTCRAISRRVGPRPAGGPECINSDHAMRTRSPWPRIRR
jgi:hypothetical protein